MNLLRHLVHRNGWSFETFCLHLGRAAKAAAEQHGDPRIAQIAVSQRQFTRWMAGEVKTLPNSLTRLVLEQLFGGDIDSAVDLFAAVPASAPDAIPRQHPGAAPVTIAQEASTLETSALTPSPSLHPLAVTSVDPALVPHWTGMLRILSAANNALGPAQIHQSAVQEMAVIRHYRDSASGELGVSLIALEARWAEFASWTAETMGDGQRAAFWLDQALHLARTADDPAMVAYVLMRQAQRAVERREVHLALSLSGQAWESAGDSARDRALCALRQGQAHALAGDRRGSERAVAQAARLVEEAEVIGPDSDPTTIGVHCVPAYVRAHEAHCLMLLGQHHAAVTALEAVLARWPSDLRQDGLLARIWLAMSLLHTDRLDEAGALGSEILKENASVGFGRIHHGLRTLDRLTERLQHRPREIDTFRASLAMIPPRM